MSTDEQQIRDLVATWMTATWAGDIRTVLSVDGRWLLARDANMLTPVEN